MRDQMLREDQVRDPTQQAAEHDVDEDRQRRMQRRTIPSQAMRPHFDEQFDDELDDELDQQLCKERQGHSPAGQPTALRAPTLNW